MKGCGHGQLFACDTYKASCLLLAVLLTCCFCDALGGELQGVIGFLGRGRRTRRTVSSLKVARGVRDDPLADANQDAQAFGDDELDRNDWLGSSKAYDFRVMDDLNPVAPMDGVSPPSIVSIASPEPLPAENHGSIYIPPYKNPDAFPVVKGPRCLCTKPKWQPPTDEEEDWAAEVRKQLGELLPKMVEPLRRQKGIHCECEREPNGTVPHDWSRLEAIPNSAYFVIEPSDSTYPSGNYWHPSVNGGIVAPADTMSTKHYPTQASADKIGYLPAMAREDRIGLKFARYIDQVEDRSIRCDGDGVSEQCITDCRPGDEVIAEIGPTRIRSRIVSTHFGGALVAEFTPAIAKGMLGAVACPVTSGCSLFRTCYKPGAFCVELEHKPFLDYLGRLQRTPGCPAGTQVCGKVQQVFDGKYLRKDGKLCRASRPIATSFSIGN